jgi:P-type Cu+ transporter
MGKAGLDGGTKWAAFGAMTKSKTQKITYSVDGMTCAACVGRTERVLRAQSGVLEATVNLATQSAHVTFAAPATAQSLAGALGRAGYPARENVANSAPALMDAAPYWRRAAWAAAGTLPVFLLEMTVHIFPALHHIRAGFISDAAAGWLQMLLIGAVLAGPGFGFFAKGIPALWRRAPDMNALVALGAGAAFAYSCAVVLIGFDGAIYFEAAGVTVTLILLGRAFEARAKGAAGQAIARLVMLQPQTATLLRGEVQAEVPLASLMIGDHILVRPGARIAADGVVIEGQSSIDTAMLTGEAMPVQVGIGDAVTGGCVNGMGSLHLRVTAAGAGTVLARITQMVSDAQAGKLPVQDMVDRVTAWFVPAVMGLSALTFAIWALAGAGFGAAMIHAVAVLIIACPCAMGLAVPVSILVGTGRGAQMGILFRGGAALQRLAEVQVVAFDKTGTLTMGRPSITGSYDVGGALALAAGIEAHSTHPLARAVLDHAADTGTIAAQVSDISVIAGQGARGQFQGEGVQVGSARMMGALPPEVAAFADAATARGEGLIFVRKGADVIGAFAAQDSIKPSAQPAIAQLLGSGLRAVMLTGDSEAVAARVAAAIGLREYRAAMLPADKAAAIAQLGPHIAFVGDGINDAPALAKADVGIAMGNGTDVAIEAGDVVLISGDLAGVARAISLSRAVMRNIRQNLVWAFGYNVALIPVAMGVLVPFGGPALSPMLGAGAMAASSVFVLANALRLRGLRL